MSGMQILMDRIQEVASGLLDLIRAENKGEE